MTTRKPTSKKKSAAGGSVPPPGWLYEQIMGNIEPDLLVENFPLLEAKYAGETEVQRKERFFSYEKAFRIFDLALADVTVEFEDTAKLYKEHMQKMIAEEEAGEKADDVLAAEKKLDNSSSAQT